MDEKYKVDENNPNNPKNQLYEAKQRIRAKEKSRKPLIKSTETLQHYSQQTVSRQSDHETTSRKFLHILRKKLQPARRVHLACTVLLWIVQPRLKLMPAEISRVHTLASEAKASTTTSTTFNVAPNHAQEKSHII